MRTLTAFWLTQYLKQGRIIIIYLLAFALFVLNAFIYTGRFEEELTTQNQRRRALQQQYESIQSPNDLSGNSVTLNLPATSTRFMVDSNLENIPTARNVGAHTSGLPQSASRQRQQLLVLWDIDLAFIVGVIFSFLAVVLTFDAVSGERERGTLKLMMSTGVPRYKLILSKIFASLIALALPLLVGLLVGYLYLQFAGVIGFDPETLVLVTLFCVFSLLLLAFYTALGALISSLTRNSITSLVVLLLIWVMLVVVTPGLAKPVTKEFARARTPEEYSRETDKIFDQLIQDFATYEASDRPPEMARADDFKYERRWNTVYGNLYNRQQALIDEQLRQLYHQADLAMTLSRFAPNMVFNLAAARIAGTDVDTVRAFLSQAAQYKAVLFNFMKGQDALDPDSPHILNNDGRGYLSSKPFTAEIPRFEFRRPPLAERLGESIMDTLILVVLAVCSLLAAVFAFNRYDVR